MSHVAWTCLAAAFRRTALPLASYYAVTLAAPFANGAARSGATFVEHALVVVVVPPIAIVLTCSVLAIGRAGLLSLKRYSARWAAAGSIRAARLLGSHAATADAPRTIAPAIAYERSPKVGISRSATRRRANQRMPAAH